MNKSDIRKYDKIYWDCICDCGNLVTICGSSLKQGLTRSCGCLQKERAAANNRLNGDPNIYIVENNICTLIVGSHVALFDYDDYEKISPYHWKYHHSGYLYTQVKNNNLFLHRFIMNAKNDQYIDHVNRNRLDNRRENLRFCTKTQNSENMSRKISNTSGIIGVYYKKESKKWIATIRIKGKKTFLGSYQTLYDATISRLKAEKEYFKEFAPQRDLFDLYNIT